MGWFDKKDDGTKGKTEVAPPDKKEEVQSKSDADLLIEKLGVTIDAKLKPVLEKVSAIDQWRTDITEGAKKATPEKKDGEPAKRTTLADASMDDEAERKWKEENLLPAYAETAKLNARLTERECLDSLGP